MSHRNARTTFHGRLLIVERFRGGWPKAHIAAAMGVSRKCVRTWMDRYESDGEAGLYDRSSRPHTLPTRTPAVIEDQIVALRRVRRCGPDALGAELGVPARTVSRVRLNWAISSGSLGNLSPGCRPLLSINARISRAVISLRGVFLVPGFAKFVVIKKPATKARKGTNPFTGEPMMFKAKPARKIVRARPVKAAKDAV